VWREVRLVTAINKALRLSRVLTRTRLPQTERQEISIICSNGQMTMAEVDRSNQEEVAIRYSYRELLVYAIYRVSRNLIGTQVLGRVCLVGLLQPIIAFSSSVHYAASAGSSATILNPNIRVY
jgi:hypothetical protein